MSVSDHCSTDLEWELGISTRGSETWSYLDLSAPRNDEPNADMLTGDEQMYALECCENAGSVPRGDGIAGFDPAGQIDSGLLSTNTPFPDQMSLPSESHRDSLEFYDELWMLNSNGFGDSALSSCQHCSGTHPTSNDPWDPVGPPRVIEHNAGYVVFLDLPGYSSSPSFPSFHSRSSRESSSLPEDIIQATQDAVVDDLAPESIGIAKQTHLQWDVINTVMNGPPKVSSMNMGDTNRRQRKGRQGPLKPQSKKEAHAMRKLRGCWPCRVSKAKCSPGSPCERCRDPPASLSHLTYRICCRAGFAEYAVLCFPELLTSHFSVDEVESLVALNVHKFVDTNIAVKLNCGRYFAPLELRVNFFKPKTDSTLLYHHHLTYLGKERMIKITSRRSAPVGILGADIRDLKKKCRSYIVSLVSHRDYARQVTTGGKSGIYRKALEIICRYSKAEKNCLLDKAVELHAMHYFMARILTFTKDSASMVIRVSKDSLGIDLSSDMISSRLLNRQLKHVMHILHQDQMKTVLEDLESHLKKRERAEWPISFCVILLLCLCMEDVQIAANNFVFSDANLSREKLRESHQACGELEDKPYRQYTQLFHDMYRSYKQPNGRGTDGGFNPISHERTFQTEWTIAAREMVSGIRRIINDCEIEMRTLSNISMTSDEYAAGALGPHRDHPARLLSKFLLSFLERP